MTWWLLGVALQSEPEAPTPLEGLADHEGGPLLDTYGSWSGRWILLSDSEIHLDAGGLLGCFYRTFDRGGHAEVWASSSAALLASLPGRRRITDVAPKIYPGKGMDWYPLPRSRFSGVSGLLPTQILSLAAATDRRVSARPPLVEVATPKTYADALDALRRSLVTSLRRVADRRQAVWLPLTAGLDSRLILAAAREANLPLTAFTQRYPLMDDGDRRVPPLLARELGYPHREIRPRRLSRSRRALFDRHTGGHCADGDRRFFAHGQWDAIQAPALILRGGVFELGRCYFHQKFPEPRSDDLLRLIAERFHFEDFHPCSSAHFDGLAAWVDWTQRTPSAGLDWRDRLYLEQRIAGWVSSIEQALDLTGHERLYVANSHTYLSTVLALPETTRCKSQHHVDLIREMAPELLQFPFNPPVARAQLRRWLRDEWRELAARPRKRRYAAYAARRSAGRARRAMTRLRRSVVVDPDRDAS